MTRKVLKLEHNEVMAGENRINGATGLKTATLFSYVVDRVIGSGQGDR